MLAVLKHEEGKKDIESWLHAKLTSLCEDGGEEIASCLSPDEAQINEYTFRHKLEEWVERASEREIREKLAHSLTLFHRGKLTEAKKLLDAELADPRKTDEDKAIILEKINAIIRKREMVAYSEDT